MLRRSAPALGLFLLSPLIAEFLLGNLSITVLPALVVLAPMYGGAAVLIREAVRRTGRGWPSILLLGLAYGVLEEAFATQSLFNPDYLKLGLGLLRPAPVPALGIGAWWTLFVLTLHTAWSVGTSVALAEALVPDRATQPWLGRAGLIVAGALFGLGGVATTLLTLQADPFVATSLQFAGAAIVAALLTAAAFRLPPAGAARARGWVPHAWLVGAGALAAASTFLLISPGWGWWAVAAYLALDGLVIAAVARWSARAGWDGRHRLALAGGAALAYAWYGFPQEPVVGARGTIDLIGNAVFALGALVVLVMAARRTAAA